jgi:tRNA (guanine37-N1)-methyltransferase
MNLSVLTLFPDLYKTFFETSIIGRAVERGELNVEIRDFCDIVDPKKRIDAPPYGPGAGMLIRPNVVSDLILEQENKLGSSFRVFFSPHGKKINQEVLKSIADRIIEKGHLTLVAPRYEGVDVRVEEHYADEILSVGDFVLMGGDLPALTFLEAFLRYVPGIVGRKESVENDSFSGPFVDYPHYTQPLVFEDSVVPDVLRSGNHQEIEKWRLSQSIDRTLKNHFDWLRGSKLNNQQLKLINNKIPNHYAALVHHDVKLPNGTFGSSSVTSIDIHDIARSATTYGLAGYYVTTPLVDQQAMVKVLLDFWHSDIGIDYNPHRHKALLNVEIAPYLNDVVQKIYEKEGVEPIIIATSAQCELDSNFITYHDQGKVWEQNRPVLLIFGTAGGLSKDILRQCDYLLLPVNGLSEFNHLSVRSAAAIIFDRWLGLNPRTI